MHNKEISGGVIIPDIKLYYRVTVVKTAWDWHKNRLVDYWNQTKDPDINKHTYEKKENTKFYMSLLRSIFIGKRIMT